MGRPPQIDGHTVPAPLLNVRVVECAGAVSTAFAGKLLGDMGATVTRFSLPGGPSLADADEHVGDPLSAASDLYFNGGKLSMSGAAAVTEAIRVADVVLLHRGALRDERFAPEAMLLDDPAVVVTTITPYGTVGPRADWEASDFTLQARGGFSYGVGERDGSPLPLPGQQAALQGGMVGAIGSLLALLARDGGRGGQHVDISIDDVLSTFFTGYYLPRFFYGGGIPGRRAGRVGTNSSYPNTVLRCRDGLVAMIAPQREQWIRFVKLMGEPAWTKEPRYRDRRAMQWEYKSEVDEKIEPWFLDRTKDELIGDFVRHRIPFAPILTGNDLLDNDHLQARSSITTVRHDRLGDVSLPAAPYLFDGVRPAYQRARDDGYSDDASARECPAGMRVPVDSPPSPLGGALAGIRILDLGTAWAGGIAGRLLADFGAEVIKVECRRHLDGSRLGRPVGVDDTDGGDEGRWPEMQPGFHVIARNKLSVGIDLATPGAVEIIVDLASRCDAVVHNFAAGVIERLGLTDEALRSKNPDLVIAGQSIAGYAGPLASYIGYNTTVGGLSGLFGLIGVEGEEPIGSAEGLFSDIVSAFTTVFATLSALKGALGTTVEVSQWEATLALIPELLIAASAGVSLLPSGRRWWGVAPDGMYSTASEDGWIALTVADAASWHSLCELIDRRDLEEDPCLCSVEGRRKDAERVDGAIAAWAARHTATEAVAHAQGVGIAAAVASNIQDLFADEHLRSRDAWVDTDHPLIGYEPLPGVGIRLSSTPGAVRDVAPIIGQHTRAVLTDLLEYTPDAVDALVAAGVIELASEL
jgi:crotonobetainyl-CoA:carnitine CoA-transferase CaiB-like acyl-CoA transferase